ncbi:hypothetical protein IFR05_009112 [Cadophora sp. M221]|nr:hypothetical protein IFR05_009112 [Cadophora sp. M221]
MDEHPAFEVELTLLVQSQEPVEKAFKMYSSLISYAQSFELLEPFKQDMAIGEDEAIDITEPQFSTNDLYLYRKLGNPLKNGVHPHPVEAAVMQAKHFGENEDVLSFKVERAFALQYLEPQYQRMSAAVSHLVEFVKDEKCTGGIFDCYGYEMDDAEDCLAKFSVAMLLLEDYDASFNRDISFYIKSIMRRNRTYYDQIYSERGIGAALMEQLNTAIEIQKFDGFIQDYKLAVNKLATLFLATQHARKQLFKWDPEVLDDRRCQIDPEIERSGDTIQWDVNEPSLGPDEFEEHYEASSAGDSDDGSTPDSDDDDESDHGNGWGENANDSDHGEEDGEGGDDVEAGEEEDGASKRSESMDDDDATSDVRDDEEEVIEGNWSNANPATEDREQQVDDVVLAGTDGEATLGSGQDGQVDRGGW